MEEIRLGQTMRVKETPSRPFKGWVGKVQATTEAIEPDNYSIQLAFEPDDVRVGETQANPSFVWFLAEELEVVNAPTMVEN